MQNDKTEQFRDYLDLKEPQTAENSSVESIYLTKAEYEQFSYTLGEAQDLISAEMEF